MLIKFFKPKYSIEGGVKLVCWPTEIQRAPGIEMFKNVWYKPHQSGGDVPQEG